MITWDPAAAPAAHLEARMSFANKVAVVVGGSTGIGAAVTRALAREGARVWVASNLTVEAMRPFCEELSESGANVRAIQCDIAERNAVLALVDEIRRSEGRLNILVNCAGIIYRTPAFDLKFEHVERIFAVNTLGAINLVAACLPLMRETGGGSIVSIASSAAILGVETTSVYSASKAALVHFTRTLAPELRRTGIRINCVAPGSVRTPMLGFVDGEPLTQAQEASVAKRTAVSASPYGEGMIQPEDIANTVLFLASDAARAFHGACLVADQGITAAMPPAGG
jgi:3-oxoacyl-[acyl-carrier protein] reductase